MDSGTELPFPQVFHCYNCGFLVCVMMSASDTDSEPSGSSTHASDSEESTSMPAPTVLSPVKLNLMVPLSHLVLVQMMT